MNKKLFALAVMALVCLLAFSSCGRIADTDTSTNDEKPNDNIQNTDTTDNDTSSDKETTQKSYASVLLYLDGGTMIDGSSLEKKVELYTMLSSPSIPVKEGYRFVGWSVDGTLVSFPYPITKNTVFNAVWSLNDDTDIDTGVNTDTDTDTSIEESTDSKKYDYDMNEYISLPNYKNHIVDLELDSLQMAIDTYLRNNATEYVVSRGDDIYVDITVYEAKEKTTAGGSTYKEKGSKIDELSKTNYFVENLGVSDLPYAIEIDIINSTLTISDNIVRFYEYDQLEDYCPEAYEGKEFYFDIKITDKIIAEGDVVDVDFRGYYIDDYGNILKDSDGENVSPFSEGENSRFFIGSKLAIDDFENNLVGETIGEEFSFYATFPDDYSEDDLKGKKVIFYATVKSVYTTPVYNDAFVQAWFSDYSTVAEFESALKNDYIMNEMFSYVLDNAEVLEYPEAEYNEIKESIEESEETFEKYYGYSFDTYIENAYGMTRDEYIKSQMKTEMVYYTIARQEGLEPTDEMLTNEKASLIDYYKVLYMEQGYDEKTALSTAEEFVGNLGDIYIYENVLFELVEECLLRIARVNEIPKTYTSVSEKDI